MKTAPAVRAPGRPRDPAVDRTILEATIRLLAEQGYDAMSLEGVAAAAGVGKTTIYRRYPGKRDLVVAAIASIAASLPPPADTGSARHDLRAFLRQALDVLRRDGLGFAMMGTLLVKERVEPGLIEEFRRAVILPRMALGAAIVRRGIVRNEIRPDVDVDAVVQLLAGSFLSRHLAGQPDDDAWLDAIVDLLWEGLALEG